MKNYASTVEISGERRVPSAARRIAGFTAVEMLIVVAIFGIMATVAAPSFSTLIAAKRAEATATDLYVALVQARSEATKRNVNTTLGYKTGGWHAGWVITVIDPTDSTRTLTLDDHAAVTGVDITGPDTIVYQSSGRVQGNAAPCFAVTATNGSSSAQAWVLIDLSGRPVVRATSCS